MSNYGYDPREPRFLARDGAAEGRARGELLGGEVRRHCSHTPDGPVCPVCGDECETIYLQDGEVVGCDRCVDAVDAYDMEVPR